MTKKKIQTAIKPFLTEVLVTALALFLLAFLMLKMEWGNETLRTGIQIVYGLACFLGGWSAGHGAERKKFLRGLAYGALYFLLLCLLSLSGGGELTADSVQIMTVFGICIAAGMAGGMFSGFLGAR